jgi:bacterioferritin-associated ferredoxin
MYVCICRAVTDSQIRHAANNGASTLKDLRQSLGVASECGQCASCAKDCLRKHSASNTTALQPALA